MSLAGLILDAWSSLSYKRAMGDGRRPGLDFAQPEWVDEDNARRLRAYLLLQSFVDNNARYWLDTTSDEVRASRREYGDAALIVKQTLAAVVGDEQAIAVAGADTYDPDLLPPDAPDDSPGQRAGSPEEWAANEAALAAAVRQDWLQEWATRERFWLKLVETERRAVSLGDGVYSLGWSTRKGRVRVRPYDPGMYFPAVDDEDNDDDYPRTVHLAWEFTRQVNGTETRFLRRITYRLGPISPRTNPDPGPFAEDDVLRDARGRPVPRDGDDMDPLTGRITRRMPWHEAGDEPSDETCYLTDATWEIADVRRFDDLDPDRATYAVNEDGEELRDLDIGVDFIPLVHVPNTVAEIDHFGQSVLYHVTQIIDDIQAADTDLSSAAATTGTPSFALSGVKPTRRNADGTVVEAGTTTAYGPGTMYFLGENGAMHLLDTSKALDALIKYRDSLRKLLSENSRMPAAVLGRVDGSDVPSGFALLLSFGPLQAMVREARMVRAEKYPLLLRFVQKLAMVGGALAAGPLHNAHVTFGSYLPADRKQVVEEVKGLLEAKAISRLTAVTMLIEAGFTIVDAAIEVARIASEDFEGADQLASATGAVEPVYEYLGIEPPAIPAPAPDDGEDGDNLPPQ